MGKLEKFIYSFKYLPPILYFGSVGLILLDIFLDIELIGDKLIIPLWILFFYMSYLGSKNYKSGDFNVLEKFIYSIKYLPQVLYFGTLAWVNLYILFWGLFRARNSNFWVCVERLFIKRPVFLLVYIYYLFSCKKSKNKR